MKKNWLPLVSLLAMLQWGNLQAQHTENMVFNGSFEEYSTCPQRIDATGIMNGVDAWWQPSKGSSDYFNACGGRECLTPRNKMGIQEAHDGVAYCGIYCSKENYREYLQTELREPLVAGKRYRVSYWVSLADKSPFAVASLGALFTQERINDTTWNILMQNEVTDLGDGQRQVVATYYRPQVVNGELLDKNQEWQLITGEFKAKGGERFLTLGNFNSFNHSYVVATDFPNAVLSGAYYYIDDVSVICLDCATDTVVMPVTVTEEPKEGDIITLHNVLFDTDKSDLLPQSYLELHTLISLLEKHPTMRVELRGHTDNQGTVERNRVLSEARAKAVADYLESHGIDRSRLTWRGFGKNLPVDTNATPEGRQNNRRVEYRILSE